MNVLCLDDVKKDLLKCINRELIHEGEEGLEIRLLLQ